MQQNLESCNHIIVVCSEQLYQAFACIDDPALGVVEMFQGHVYANAALPCIHAPKVSLVFLDRPKSQRIVPLPQLRDRRSFTLSLNHLLSYARNDPALLEEAILRDPAFRDFRDLIEHLQH